MEEDKKKEGREKRERGRGEERNYATKVRIWIKGPEKLQFTYRISNEKYVFVSLVAPEIMERMC